MKYDSKFYKDYLEKVSKFGELNWVENYIELRKKPNFWTVLEYGQVASSRQKSSHEIRYSKMLRWLLDANENHRLGNTFAYKLLQVSGLEIDYHHQLSPNKLIKSSTEALDNIDIFYKDMDEKICIAIELKQFTGEHESTGYDSQLDKYEDSVGRFIKNKDQNIRPFYIYLTPLREKASNENWISLGYKEIINIINEIDDKYLARSNNPYRHDIEKIIYDFKDDLQRTIDILERDVTYVRNNFSKDEIDFTGLLANELSQEVESKYLDKLIQFDSHRNPDLEALILLINEYNYTQDHTPNDGVRLLMRKIYNYISQDPDLSLDLNISYSNHDRFSEIKPGLIDKYGLNFHQIELTRGKGQGIKLHHKDIEDSFIYFSGDKDGHFPNDYMSILEKPSVSIIRSKNIINRMFQIDYDLIKENKVTIKRNKESSDLISFTSFMEDYMMEEIRVLNNRLATNQ